MLNFLHLKGEKGISIMESLTVVFILFILVLMSTVAFLSWQKKSDLENNVQKMINILRMAQNRTLSSEDASRFGVYFNNSALPHQYILFKGENYAARNLSFDEIHQFSKNVEIYEINLNGQNETVFNRISGEAIPAGNVKIRLISDPAESAAIFIENSGQIGLNNPSSPGTAGLVKDSRHSHFDLGWSIKNAATLKFFFPGTGQTETVDMINYFDAAKTEFYWTGSFSVAGSDQIFIVHTHFLDDLVSPYTTLCIHRGRNNNSNNQETIIYITDAGTDKEIAHYLADPNDTLIKGSDVQTMEIQ